RDRWLRPPLRPPSYGAAALRRRRALRALVRERVGVQAVLAAVVREVARVDAEQAGGFAAHAARALVGLDDQRPLEPVQVLARREVVRTRRARGIRASVEHRLRGQVQRGT